jgi:mRNA-degrading endonuclease toxin of MazEF toxin-antitoxin module
MAIKPKHGGGNSMAASRAMVEMAKTMDLAAIARRTGREPESILKTAKRLGISIKGKPARK